MNWISADEKLPEDCQDVLLFAINEMGTKELMVGHIEKCVWHYCCLFYVSIGLHNVKVTHWCELPDYPS